MDDLTPSPSDSRTTVRLSRVGFGAITASFVLIGATTSLFGPLLVTFSERFHVSTPVAGQVLAIYFGGGVLGIIPGWIGVRRVSGRSVLNVALVTVALGLLVAAAATSWLVLLVGAGVLGVGFGAIGIVLNTLLTRTSVEGRAWRLSVANAGFGAGAVVTPLLLIALHPTHYARVMLSLGALSVALVTSTRGIHAPAHRDEVHSARRLDPRRRRRLLVTFVVAYVLYESVESGASGWMATQLHGAGYSDRTGILVTSGFWAGMALARSFGGPLHRHLRAPGLVIGSFVLACLCAVAVRSDALAPFGYPALGLIIASIYPMGLMWFSTLSPHDSDATSAIILFAMAGSVIGPGVIDLLVVRYSVHVVPLAVAAFSGLGAAVFALVLRAPKEHSVDAN